MKIKHQLIVASLLLLTNWMAAAEPDPALNDEIALLRTDLAAGRKAVLIRALEMTDPESQALWPMYDSYAVELSKVHDRRLKKALPEKKILQFVQVENKIDLLIDVQISARIPLAK